MTKKLIFLLSFFSMLVSTPVKADTAATITRDSYGMPMITGGSLSDVAQAIGLAQAQDRLWQIFYIVQVANGRAAQYLGSDFLDSDIMQHQINYTDAQVQNQINNFFTYKTKAYYQSYVAGLNSYVHQVNANLALMPYELQSIGFGASAPIPDFTIYDIIRAGQFVMQLFSPSSIPSYQLTNLSDLQQLVTNFGVTNALQIFNDIDPTTAQVKSDFTIVGSPICSILNNHKLHGKEYPLPSSFHAAAEDARQLAKRLLDIKAFRKKSGMPSLGSNGEVISAQKSVSGNPLMRMAPQPNFNHPSDFYQIWVDCNQNGDGFRGNFFTFPTLPITAIGIFNNFGVGLQVGHLPSNDFLYEPVANAKKVRTDTILVQGGSPVVLDIYRSTSGGWVLTQITPTTTSVLTLRSVFIDKQLRTLNTFVETAYTTNTNGLFASLLNPAWQSDILLLEGESVDVHNTTLAFHTGGWTQLPAKYDRRLPQGIPLNPAASNLVYNYNVIVQAPLTDCGQDFYVGWNSLFKQGAAGSSDTVFPIGVNRMYWLYNYIQSFAKLSFDDLKNIGLRQYQANNNTAFDDSALDEDADLFTILFKDRFFQAISNPIYAGKYQSVINFLQDFDGSWFDGDLNHILNVPDVSDKRILASVWMNAVANAVLNPYLVGTSREVATATKASPVPTFNPAGVYNDLTSQANTLSRIFNLACDNTIFFGGWLNSQPTIDQIIVNGLDFALHTLGGFNSQPWGKGKRGVYQFNNVILGPVQTMLDCNVSGLVIMAEFTPSQIIMKSILALGESGQVLGTPPGTPQFNAHNFDQQPLFSQLQLRSLPPFQVTP